MGPAAKPGLSAGAPPLRAPWRRRADVLIVFLIASGIAAAVLKLPKQHDTWLVWHLRMDALGDRGRPAGVPPLPQALLRHFAIATPTASHRHELVKGMRAWRRGVPTLILTNASGDALVREQAEGEAFGEQWVHVPDLAGFAVTNKSGDMRAAVAPALAAAYLPRFKWLLFCDDDVAFFWGGVLRMLRGLDPADPYFLTDSYWSRFSAEEREAARAASRPFGGSFKDGRPYVGLRNSQPPKPDQPRCLPCTLNDTGLDLAATHGLKTCQCTVRRMASAFAPLLTGDNQWQGFPRQPPIVSFDGGGGAVFSAGLLSHLDSRLFQSCVAGKEGRTGGPTACGGGDCLLTACLWHQGFAYTDPGFELLHRSTHRPGMFLFNGARSDWRLVNRWASDALVGACAGNCSRLWLDHMVSVHTAGANMSDFGRGAAQVARFLGVMSLFSASLGPSLDALAAELAL